MKAPIGSSVAGRWIVITVLCWLLWLLVTHKLRWHSDSMRGEANTDNARHRWSGSDHYQQQQQIDPRQSCQRIPQRRVFAFRGVSSTSICKISSQGLEYDKMITATGGQGYDICLDDWSQSFSQLTKSISSIAISSFTLKNTPAPESIKVFLDGQLLKSGDYTLTGTQLSLAKKPDPAKGHVVKVIYLPIVAKK